MLFQGLLGRISALTFHTPEKKSKISMYGVVIQALDNPQIDKTEAFALDWYHHVKNLNFQ